MDHQDNFEALVRTILGDVEVDWAAPRLICVAGEYKKFDLHATNQINRNIDLFRYEKYGKSHILFDFINSVGADKKKEKPLVKEDPEINILSQVEKAPEATQKLWQDIETFILDLGDEVSGAYLKYYAAFKTVKNFVCLEIKTQKRAVQVTLPLDPKKIDLEEGFSRDVTNIGHLGTGNLQIEINSYADFEKAKVLIEQAYREVS